MEVALSLPRADTNGPALITLITLLFVSFFHNNTLYFCPLWFFSDGGLALNSTEGCLTIYYALL